MLKAKKAEKEKHAELLKENRSFEAKVLSQKSGASMKKRKTPSMNLQKKAKISRGHVGNIKGHIGSFSNGVLRIKKHDLKKLNASK